MATDKKAPMTWGDIAAKVATFTPEQLAAPVIWWGEDRAGEIFELMILDCMWCDGGYGVEPLSAYPENEHAGMKEHAEETFAVGTPVLMSDV